MAALAPRAQGVLLPQTAPPAPEARCPSCGTRSPRFSDAAALAEHRSSFLSCMAHASAGARVRDLRDVLEMVSYPVRGGCR